MVRLPFFSYYLNDWREYIALLFSLDMIILVLVNRSFHSNLLVLLSFNFPLFLRYEKLSRYAPTSNQRGAFHSVVKKATLMLSLVSLFTVVRLILLCKYCYCSIFIEFVKFSIQITFDAMCDDVMHYFIW